MEHNVLGLHVLGYLAIGILVAIYASTELRGIRPKEVLLVGFLWPLFAVLFVLSIIILDREQVAANER